MVKKRRRWGGPRPAPYNPNARDADNDGMVQEGTIWERPGGSKYVDRLGKEISAAAAAVTPGAYIADERGNRIDYTPTWQRGGAPGAPGEGDLTDVGTRPSLGDLGYPSIGDMGGTIRDTNGTVEALPDLTPDPRDVEQIGPDGVSLPDGEEAPQVPSLSGPEVEAARQRLAQEITEGALQGSNWHRSDGRGVGDGLGPEFAVEPVARFDLDDETTAKIAELGGTVFPVYEVASDLEGATEFRDAIQYAHDTHKFGTSVTVYDLEDYQGGHIRLFLSPDKKTGFAVTADGQLVSVFNADDTTQMPLHTMVPLALSQGATRADAFDTVLPGFYAHFGLQPTARLPFDDDYKPDGWNYNLYEKYNNGRPDVVFMRFDPDRVGVSYIPGDGDYVDDYDVGLESTKADAPAIPDFPDPDIQDATDDRFVSIDEPTRVEGILVDDDHPAPNTLFQAELEDTADIAIEALDAEVPLGGQTSRRALYEYQNKGFVSVNERLRNDEELDEEYQAKHDALVAAIDASVFDQDYTVYRGFKVEDIFGEGVDSDEAVKSLIGTRISDKGFMSTSADPDVGLTYGLSRDTATGDAFQESFDLDYIVMRIEMPAGTPGLYSDTRWDEKEVVLKPGQEFEVVGVTAVRNPQNGLGAKATGYVMDVRAVDKEVPAESAVTEAVEADAVVDRVAEAVTPITEVGATDLYRFMGAGHGGPRAGDWDTLKKWGPGDSDLTRRYSMNPSGLNSKLRSGDLTPEDVEFADALSEYIGQARTERPYTVYRGLPATTILGDIPEGEMDAAVKALVGETVSDDGFLSTSANPNIASMFMYRYKGREMVGDEEPGVMMRIAVPRGAEGGLAIQSPYQEQEVLYERGTKLQVTGVTKLPNLDGREKPVYVLNTELVPPDVPEGEAPPLIQEVTSFTGHDKKAPFDGLEAHLIETSKENTLFSGFQSGVIVGYDNPADSTAEDTLRRLIGGEIELPEGASVTANPAEALEAAAVRTSPYYKPGQSSQVALKINLPEGVDKIPDGASLRVVGVEKSQPPQTRDGKLMKPPTFVVEVDVVPGDTPPPKREVVDVDSDITDFLQQHKPGEADVLQTDADRIFGKQGAIEFYDPNVGFEISGRFALDQYVNGAWGEEVNNDLRKTPEERISPESGEDLFEKVDGPRVAAIDSMLEATSAPEPYTAYRGVSGTMFFDDVGRRPQQRTEDEVRAKLESMIGDTIADDGYMSTSIKPEVAIGFADDTKNPVILRIDVPKGGKGLYLAGTIERDIHSEDEQEVLLPRGSELKVTGVSALPNDRGRTTFVVDVEAVQGQELSRTATEVADDIAAAIEGTLTERIERSILGEI